ncbi:DUF6193 family natural product biosynthesis protein [Streptomyces sp. NPDC001935]
MTVDGSESDWKHLLDVHKPPHGEDDWFGLLFWPLLQAAAEIPTLRRVFPSTSVNSLVVFRDGQAWKAPVEERWPAVSVGSDGLYTVRSQAWSRDARDLLVTRDPGEAVRCLAGLIEGIIGETGQDSGR